MGLKGLAIFAVLLAIAQAPAVGSAQSTGLIGAMQGGAYRHVAAILITYIADSPDASTSATGGDSAGGVRDFAPPRVTVANAPATPAVWPLHERISWAANLVLTILGYAGILMAYSLLKKIERQTAYAESAAEAAAAASQAALLNAQAVIHSERPWILITIEPSRSMENSFMITATNRGRTPARITATAEGIRIAGDERHLPTTPQYRKEEQKAPLVPIILVPGESTTIKLFSRDDVKALCDSEETFKRIETWEEKIFIHGSVVYTDLIAAPDSEAHQTNWCCWYIHGRQNSGLVIAGPPEYNSHI